MKPIVNMQDLQANIQTHGDHYEARFYAVGSMIGAKQLGYRIAVLPPGKRAFPFHAHLANEEMFFVLSGSGQVRMGSDLHPIREGDFISCPAGGVESAHQIINSSDQELRYLCVSTMHEPDVGLYPDSRKFLVFAGAAPGGPKEMRTFSFVGRVEAGVDYWDGE